MSGSFQFGYLSSVDLLLRIGAVNVYNAAPQNIEAYNIPGRIGEYLPEDAVVTYPNEIREYVAALFLRNATAEEVQDALSDVRKHLMPFVNKYDTLTDSYEPGFYRRAYFTGEFIPERLGAGNNFQIPIRFSCDPRRFILPETSEEIPSGQLNIPVTNTEGFPAWPLLEITGSGSAFTVSFERNGISVGSVAFKSFPSSLTITFDCETTNAVRSTGATANDLVSQVNGTLTIEGMTDIRKSNANPVVKVYNRFWTR